MIVEPQERIVPGPFSEHLGFRIVSHGTDEVVMAGTPGPEHCNSGGRVHGGYLASLLDSTTGWAVHAHVDPGTAIPHLQLSVQYLRAALPGEAVECRARCVTSGRRVLTAEGHITQAGRLVAKASTTHIVGN